METLSGKPLTSDHLIMDRAYEGDETRQLAFDLGFEPIVPPKKKTFDHVDDKLIDMIAYKLNHRPRKSLGFKTPHEVFFNTSQRLTEIALAN